MIFSIDISARSLWAVLTRRREGTEKRSPAFTDAKGWGQNGDPWVSFA